MAAVARRFGNPTSFYGEGTSTRLMARLRLAPSTVKALADTYRTEPAEPVRRQRQHLRPVPAPEISGPTFEDLSGAMRMRIRRECRRRGYLTKFGLPDVSRVKILSLTKVLVP